MGISLLYVLQFSGLLCAGGHDIDEADIKVRLAAASIYARLLAARAEAAPIRAFRADPVPHIDTLNPDLKP